MTACARAYSDSLSRLVCVLLALVQPPAASTTHVRPRWCARDACVCAWLVERADVHVHPPHGHVPNTSPAHDSRNAVPTQFQRSEQFKAKSAEMAALPKGSKAYTPKDLELFEASEFQQRSCYRGYDKVTKAPDHGELPPWKVRPEVFEKLKRGF